MKRSTLKAERPAKATGAKKCASSMTYGEMASRAKALRESFAKIVDGRLAALFTVPQIKQFDVTPSVVADATRLALDLQILLEDIQRDIGEAN